MLLFQSALILSRRDLLSVDEERFLVCLNLMISKYSYEDNLFEVIKNVKASAIKYITFFNIQLNIILIINKCYIISILIRQNSIAPYQSLFYSNSDLLTVGYLLSGKYYFKRLED